MKLLVHDVARIWQRSKYIFDNIRISLVLIKSLPFSYNVEVTASLIHMVPSSNRTESTRFKILDPRAGPEHLGIIRNRARSSITILGPSEFSTGVDKSIRRLMASFFIWRLENMCFLFSAFKIIHKWCQGLSKNVRSFASKISYCCSTR